MTLLIEAPARVNAGSYMRVALGKWASRHAWWMLLVLAMCTVLACYDVRWCVGAIVLYLAALMMLLTLVYFNYAFSPQARWSVMEKTVSLSEQGIHMAFAHPRMNDHYIAWREITRVQLTQSATVLNLNGPVNFVMLPPLTPEQKETFKRLYLNTSV
ncbi:MAG: hypothetical protein KBT13_11790 [Bacteroidales bacterium]|nr:hypothetical protein [Candidatus Sodaliphilus limicaballi]